MAAHALDELHDRPLRTRISDGWLVLIASVSMIGALVIGALAVVSISLWALPFVAFGAVIVPAYNLEWWRGRLHSDVWFGIAWGAFPAIVGYWANAERVDIQVALLATACFLLSLAQRRLSTYVRRLRRDASSASGYIESRDQHVEAITIPTLLEAPEAALRLLALSIILLALALLAVRL